MSFPALPLIGLGLSVGGSFLQAGSAASAAKAETKIANAQLKMDIENERIRGMQEASNRQEEYLRNESANRVAAAAGTGGGINISYEQGIAPWNKKVAVRDMSIIGFNTGQRIGRLRHQIKVNKWSAQSQARAAYVGAAADALGSVGGFLSSGGLTRSRSPSQ